MFSFKSSLVTRGSSTSLSDEEGRSFLHPNEKTSHITTNDKKLFSIFPYLLSLFLALMLTFSLFNGWKFGGNNGSYEAGFATELRRVPSADAFHLLTPGRACVIRNCIEGERLLRRHRCECVRAVRTRAESRRRSLCGPPDSTIVSISCPMTHCFFQQFCGLRRRIFLLSKQSEVVT